MLFGIDAGVWVTIALALIGGGFTLWRWLDGKIEKAKSDAVKKAIEETAELEKRIELMKTAADNERKSMKDRLDKVEASHVPRDDFRANNEHVARLVEGISLALREMGATMTQRIDMVLFEVGRARDGGK